ncbi:hypothetical protein N9N67_06805 [Bacteriovoracaceae bacterium]|nr:hypothetical protein [Bacteriovoracaceae bacterium]
MKESKKFPLSQITRWVLVTGFFFSLNLSREKIKIKINHIAKEVHRNQAKKMDDRVPASLKPSKKTNSQVKKTPPTLRAVKVKDLRKTMNTTEMKSILLDHFFPNSLGEDYQIQILSYKDALYKKAHFEVNAYKVQVEIKRKSDGAINNFSLWFDKKNQVVLDSFGKNKIEFGKNVRLSHPLLQQ